jgi:predicted metal-dependent phosphoesterase TrpH
VLKVELHAHTRQDPADLIPHTTRQLIDRAGALGYDALAITLHDRYYDAAMDQDYARAKGIVLIPGIERTVDGCHVLLLNFPACCGEVSSVDDVRTLRERYPRGLVVAPHPFYPIPSALGRRMEVWADVIDAVEVNAMFTARIDFNRRATLWARAHGKPVVGTTDLHLLAQLGTTYTLVDAPPDPDAICDAIRRGCVAVRSTPLAWPRAAALFVAAAVLGAVGRGLRLGRR